MVFSRLSSLTPPSSSARDVAARKALDICAAADSMANEALHCAGENDERMFELLERREEILQSLAEHIVSLKLGKYAADSPLFAASERAADEGDELVEGVCAALDVSQKTTMALAARVAARVSELRAELALVQRAGSVQTAYMPATAISILDSRR